jgi:hypothetical protein
MKSIFNLSILAVFLTLAANPCFAEITIEHVSKERAKALGIEIRLKGNGPREVWVEMDFKAVGELKDFNHVSLEVHEGEKGEKLLIGWAPLRGQPDDSGRVHVGFMANREFLDKVTLRIMTGHGLGRSGHDLRVRDFVDLKKDP